MNKQFFLLFSLVGLIFLASAQAQFTIEANVSGSWETIADGDLVPDQDVVIFGPVDTGVVIDRDFRFTNNTAKTVEISDAGFPNSEFKVLLSERKIESGESKTFTVRYTAGTASVDSICKVTNDSSGETATYEFSVRGLVTPLVPSYTVSGRVFGGLFEEISSGDTSPATSDGTLFASPSGPGVPMQNSFKISNTGGEPITFTGQSFSGPQAAQFTELSLPSLPFTLEAGAEQQFTLRWTTLEAGKSDATFELLSELSPAPFTFAMSGTAMGTGIRVTPPGTSLSIRDQEPTSSQIRRLRYGLIDLGTQESRTYTIRNLGFDTLFITSITADNPAFVVGHSIVGIAPREEETFTIDFVPTVVGHEEALIAIESNAPGNQETFNFITEGVGESNVGSPEIVVTFPLIERRCPAGGHHHHRLIS